MDTANVTLGKPSRALFFFVYFGCILGAEVANYIVIRDLLWPEYGAAAILIALVYGSVWLGASMRWILLRKRDAVTLSVIWVAIGVVTLIQIWAGWSAMGKLGQDIAMAGVGQNIHAIGLLILRHVVLPLAGLWAVHSLGHDWDAITGHEVVAATTQATTQAQVATASDRPDDTARIVTALVEAQVQANDRILEAIGMLGARIDNAISISMAAAAAGGGDADDGAPGARRGGRRDRYPEYVELADLGLTAGEIAAKMKLQDRQIRRYAERLAAEDDAPVLHLNGASAET